MSNTVSKEQRVEATRAFVEHLRRNPDEVKGDPAALAARFGLETEFVRRALVHRRAPKSEGERGPTRLRENAGDLVLRIQAVVARESLNPLRFEAVSLVVAGALIVLSRFALPSYVETLGPVRQFFAAGLILFAVAVQMAVFYARRMVRYAFYGGLLFGAGTALPLMVGLWVSFHMADAPLPPEYELGGLVFLVGFFVLLVGGGLYAGLAALASLAGSWAHLRRAEIEWEQLSRQELLERYFELQRRLERSTPATPEGRAWDAWPPVRAVRASPFVASGVAGVLIGLAEIALDAFGTGATPSTVGFSEVLVLIHGLFAFAIVAAVAFFSGRASRGAWCGLAATVGYLAALLLPVAGFGSRYVLANLAGERSSLAVALVVGTLAGFGGTVQRRAARDARLLRNDDATLVAHMLEIQWRLEEDATRVTVLAVDAAKSTAMKAGADPLDVEYSFREYQTWIAECCGAFEGRVHSFAGDGAVVAFADGAAAMAAARRLQTDLARFNAEGNRLPKPFRLRLGLHAGQVAGDLDDVQFTEVIDIAAHVEEIAPVGGIAATGAVVSGLGEEGFLPLAREIDGQSVFIALVPTEA